jgi:hypothetical protein
LSYLEIFATGMIAAALAIEGRTLFPNWALTLIVLAGLVVLRLGSGNGLVLELATAAAFFGVLQLALDPAGRVTRVLSAPWLVWFLFVQHLTCPCSLASSFLVCTASAWA